MAAPIAPIIADNYLMQNLALCVGFGCIHSGLARGHPDPIYHTIYATLSAIAMLVVIWLWVPGPVLWHVAPSSWLTALQMYAFLAILCQCLLLDPEAMIGYKQARFAALGLNHPMAYVSRSLQRLTTNIRHPMLLAPITAILATPTVTADRAFLAAALLFYMVVASSPTWADFRYVWARLRLKQHQVWFAWPL